MTLYSLKAPTQNLNRKADPCDVAADVSAPCSQAAYWYRQLHKTFSSELSIQHSTLQRITTLQIRSMKNSKNSTRNDCREAGPGVPGDRGLRGPHIIDDLDSDKLCRVLKLVEHLFWAFPMMYLSSLYALDLIEVRHTLWIMFLVDIMYSSMSSLSRNTCSGSS